MDKEVNPFTEDVWAMVKECSYFSIPLNMNDTFGYATAESVDCEFFDLDVVAYLFKKYGHAGVTAWAAVKENQDPIKPWISDLFLKAKAEIESDPSKFYWETRYKNWGK